jgi:hypothetical protein
MILLFSHDDFFFLAFDRMTDPSPNSILEQCLAITKCEQKWKKC